MSKTSDGTKDQPQFASSGNTPTFAADLTLVSDFFAARSNRRFATAAALLASSGSGTDDWAVATNAPGAYFRWSGSAWQMFGVPEFASSAARATALAAPGVGWLSRLTTEMFKRRWNGSAWKPYGMSEFPIIPSTIAGSGCTLGPEGEITLSGATALNINGAFSADFDNYLLTYELVVSGSADLTVRTRLSGTDQTAASYIWQYLQGLATTASAGNGGGFVTLGNLQPALGNAGVYRSEAMQVSSPALAAETVFLGETMAYNSASGGLTPAMRTVWWGSATAHDGLSLILSAGTMSGKMRLFGKNKN